MKTHDYDSDYLARLTVGWNKLSFPIIAPILRDTLKTCAPKRLLDFGSGAGAYAGVLAEGGGKVSACDISEDCIAACEDKYASVFLLKDPADLPSEEYDFLFSTEVLEHIKDYRAALGHFHRALRSSGVVLLTTTAYSTSIFTVMYRAKNSGVRLPGLAREFGKYLAGYFSEERRDRFVEEWCFEQFGGHYHGFPPGALRRAFRQAGFSVEHSGALYVIQPLKLPFLYSNTLGSIAKKKAWPMAKRLLAMALYIVGHPLNAILKRLHLLANNVYIVARKS